MLIHRYTHSILITQYAYHITQYLIFIIMLLNTHSWNKGNLFASLSFFDVVMVTQSVFIIPLLYQRLIQIASQVNSTTLDDV